MFATADLDLKTAAQHSGRSVSTLRRYIHAGRLPSVKYGSKLYVARASLDATVRPAPLAVTESEYDAWVRRMVDAAPPLRPEQCRIILSAFASARGGV